MNEKRHHDENYESPRGSIWKVTNEPIEKQRTTKANA